MPSASPPAGLRHSPLHAAHLAAGARLAPFAGWLMPLEYPGGGVVREHTAVRTTVGVFDVSHLGKLRIRGPGARDFANRCLTADLDRLAPGQAQYTLCCEPDTGGILDDLIAYLISDAEVLLVPNAANTAELHRRMAPAAPGGVSVEDQHEAYAVIAVQGPRSADVLGDLGLPAAHRYMTFETAYSAGAELLVCRSGYTGELGYELLVPAAAAPEVWAALGRAVAAREGLPCGLGARDTLRTEMGYPLHGQDIGPDVTPVQARAAWAVGWDKPQFWGRAALVAERERGAARLLRGLAAGERGIPRPGMPVLDEAGERCGAVTSGTFSPTLRRGIGLALIDRRIGFGAQVRVDLRGRPLPAEVVRPPFVDRSPDRPAR